jgi:hypothetical protein
LARRNAAHCFIGGPKRRKQPERYVQCLSKLFRRIVTAASMPPQGKNILQKNQLPLDKMVSLFIY